MIYEERFHLYTRTEGQLVVLDAIEGSTTVSMRLSPKSARSLARQIRAAATSLEPRRKKSPPPDQPHTTTNTQYPKPNQD